MNARAGEAFGRAYVTGVGWADIVRASSALEDAARMWARAYVENQDAEPKDWTAKLNALLTAQHDLLILAGYPCSMCAKGSCPGPVNQPDSADAVTPKEVL